MSGLITQLGALLLLLGGMCLGFAYGIRRSEPKSLIPDLLIFIGAFGMVPGALLLLG